MDMQAVTTHINTFTWRWKLLEIIAGCFDLI
jgi:hypothetical protein